MMDHKSWAVALKAAATANAEKEERAAQQAALMKWTKWIHEGPADGLRRQHRLSRNVKGWTPTAKRYGIVAGVDQEDELEDSEGIRIDDLNQIRFDQSAQGPPLHCTARGGR